MGQPPFCSKCLAELPLDRMRAHDTGEYLLWSCDSPDCVAWAEEATLRERAYFKREDEKWARIEEIFTRHER